MLCSLIGLRQLKEWTKQSLREKPFSTAKGKIWTENPSSIPLKEIFTKLTWVKTCRKTHGLEALPLCDITQLLNDEQLGVNGAVRILVVGEYFYPSYHKFQIVYSQVAILWPDNYFSSYLFDIGNHLHFHNQNFSTLKLIPN